MIHIRCGPRCILRISVPVLTVIFLYKLYFLEDNQIPTKLETERETPVKYVAPVTEGVAPTSLKLGEMGAPAHVTSVNAEKKVRDDLFKIHHFDAFVSDLISLNRSLPDQRSDECRKQTYDYSVLPKASVIIIFHNEAWSVLLRTIHSVINRSPPSLLSEVILVDDKSDLDHLNDKLDKYVHDEWKGLVRIVRNPKREGLIRARLLGAKVATAPVLVFLDSHCECIVGWLPPILKSIYEDRKTVITPLIPTIDKNTFEFKRLGKEPLVPGLAWNLIYKWKKEIKSRTGTSITQVSPVMAGGLFAIDKSFFEELGTYDDKMLYWGGENMELSFKIWMCGGKLLQHKCSIIGHVFRTLLPHKWNVSKQPSIVNRIRVAAVWMDEYEDILLDSLAVEKDSEFYKQSIVGIEERKRIRQNLKCKNFSWYLKNISSDLETAKTVYKGELKCGNICFDVGTNASPFGGMKCHGLRGHQYVRYATDSKLYSGNTCIGRSKNKVAKVGCEYASKWTYNNVTNEMSLRGENLCVTLLETRKPVKDIILKPCVASADQKWIFHYTKQA